MSYRILSLFKMYKSYSYLAFEDFFSFVLGFGVLLSIGPYFVWGSFLFKFYVLFCVISYFVYLFSNRFVVNFGYGIFLLFFLILILGIPHLSFSFFNGSSILIFIFLSLSNGVKIKVFNAFYFLFSISLLPSIIVWMSLFLGADLTWERLDPASASRDAAGVFYLKYFFALALSSEIFNTSYGVIYRLAGIYDEPGVVGTLSALLIAANRGNLSSISSKIILIAGFLSFSFAFYILISIYFIFTRFRFSVVFFSFSTFLFITGFDRLRDNGLISRFILERFEILVTNPESVNNRYDTCFVNAFDRFLNGGSIFFGNGPWAHTFLGCDVSHFSSIIYNHGFFGFFFIVVFYIFLFLRSYNLSDFDATKAIAPFIFVFLLGLYQRPEFLSPAFIIIFIGACLVCSEYINYVKNKLETYVSISDVAN